MRLNILGVASLALLLAGGCSKPEEQAQPLRSVRVMKVEGAAESNHVSADYILIAVGTRPTPPPGVTCDSSRLIDSPSPVPP